MLGVAVFRLHDGNEFHLRELMLAQHAARIAPGAAGFRPEAGGKRGQAQRQISLCLDFLRGEIGQRHFRGRDQPAAIGGAEQIIGEFRQLARAIHGGVIHQQRHRTLGIAMRFRMQVQHPLPKRPFQPREWAFQHRKTRTRELGGSGEIHQAKRLTQFEMLLGCEGKLRLRAMLMLHHIGAFIAPIRHFGIKDIGECFQHGLLRGLSFRGFGFKRCHVVAQLHRFGFQRRGIGALALGRADILGKRITPRLLFLQRRLRRTPRLIMRQYVRCRWGDTASRQRCIESGRVGAQLPYVVHLTDSSMGSLLFVSFGFSVGLLRHPARCQDRNFIQQDQRHGQADLADHIGRRQHGGGHEHAYNGVAPALLQAFHIQNANPAQKRQQHRQLEGNAKGQDHLHDQRQVFANLRFQLHGNTT